MQKGRCDDIAVRWKENLRAASLKLEKAFKKNTGDWFSAKTESLWLLPSGPDQVQIVYPASSPVNSSLAVPTPSGAGTASYLTGEKQLTAASVFLILSQFTTIFQ